MIASRTSFTRLWQIRRVIRKYQLVGLLEEVELSKGARLASKILFGNAAADSATQAQRIRQALEELGPIFIKLGQALSTRPDLLPADIALELAKLQDQVPPFDGEHALTIMRETFGANFEDIFESVDSQPLASASVAQVHSATLKEGIAIEGKNGNIDSDVIVKILRPGIEEVIESDLRVMYLFASLLQKYWKQGPQFRPLEVIEEYDNTIHGELDLRREAANCSQMGANFADTDIIYVPTVYWDYTSKNVMVMERIHGTSVRDIDALKSKGHDLGRLAGDAVETFFKQAFEDNFFHADMHPGNIFVSEEGRWIAIDFGIMGVLNESDKQYLATMLLGFFNRDYRAIAEAHLRAGWIPANTQLTEFESAIRMVCEPNFAKPISEISFGEVLLQMFQTVRRFEMPVQPQLVLLYKTLLNIEGLGRQLYPQLNLWDTAKPFLERWMKQQLSPQAIFSDIKRDWPQWRALLKDLPDHLARAATSSTEEAKQQQRMLALLESDKQAKRQRKSQFVLSIGLASSVISLVAYLYPPSNLLASGFETQYLLWIAGFSLVLSYLKIR